VLSLGGNHRIFLCRRAVDFRKAHDGLCAVIRDQFKDDPFSGDVFAFFNRARDRVKLVVWDRNGFWLFYERLEKGTFPFAVSGEGRIEIAQGELTDDPGGGPNSNPRLYEGLRPTLPPRYTDRARGDNGYMGPSKEFGQREADMTDQTNTSLAAELPPSVQIEYEQILEEIRNHNTQLVTMDSIFIPVYFLIIISGITDGTTFGRWAAILIIALIILFVFLYISCRGLHTIEVLKTRIREIETEHPVGVLGILGRDLPLAGYNEHVGLTRFLLNSMYQLGRRGIPIVLSLMGSMLVGLAMYFGVGWYRFLK